MDKRLQARCDKQIENEKLLRNMSTLESEASVKVCSLLYTALDLPVSDDAIYTSQKILENKESFFSNFRGVLQALILLRMAVAKEPASYVDTIIDTYKKLESKTGVTGLFTVLSSVIITEQHADQNITDVVSHVADLYENIRKLHPDRTTSSELAYVALMYLSGKADARLENEKERLYKTLTEKLQVPEDAAKATVLVLLTNSNSVDVKVEGFVDFYNRLKATGHATEKNQYMSVYGAFADLTYLEKLGIPENETITAIGEVDDYLKKKTGYGMFSIKKDMRKVIAAALTLQHYTIEIPKDKHAEFCPEISIELLLFVVLVSLVAIS